MAKSANQKLKLLYLMQLLLSKTDENHTLSVQDMIDELAAHDISAERKSIYADLEALRTFGIDIVQCKGKTTGYYVAGRDFELPELKLLVDSVQSSKFITHKKTLSLIKKNRRPCQRLRCAASAAAGLCAQPCKKHERKRLLQRRRDIRCHFKRPHDMLSVF